MESLAKKIANNWSKKLKLSDIELIKLQYGLEIILLNISKISLIILISIFVGTFTDTVLICFLYAALRLFTFGEHAKTSIMCTVVTIVTHIVIPYILKDFVLNVNIYLLACAVISIILYFYAPADTEKHPLIGIEKREKLRNNSITTFMVIIVGTIFIPYSRLMLLVLLAEVYVVIAILPITYKILGRKRNNYEEYE